MTTNSVTLPPQMFSSSTHITQHSPIPAEAMEGESSYHIVTMRCESAEDTATQPTRTRKEWKNERRMLALTPDYQADINFSYRPLQFLRDPALYDVPLARRIMTIVLSQKARALPTSFAAARPTISGEFAHTVGGTSTVYHAFVDQKEVAVKYFRVTMDTLRSVEELFIKEAVILQSLRHPNVLPFCGTVHNGREFWLLSPWMASGNVSEYLMHNEYHTPRRVLVKQIASALHYLKSCWIVHGDLKGDNILIDSDGNACIADFGLASFQVESSVLHTWAGGLLSVLDTDLPLYGSSMYPNASGAGSVRWMAPERLLPDSWGRPDANPTFSSDIFSLGMLIYQMYSGQVPFQELNYTMAILAIVQGKRPLRVAAIPDDIWSLVEGCWSEDAAQRPDIRAVCDRLLAQDSTLTRASSPSATSAATHPY